MAKLDVIIPAGGTLEEELARVTGVNNKALIRVGEKTILKRTIEALRGSSNVGRIVLVSSQEALEHADSEGADAKLVATGASSPENIKVGLDALAKMDFPPHQVLIVTSDLPYLTTQSIDRFIELCEGEQDFYVPLVNRKDWDEVLPGTDATFVRLRDGDWTTGCVYLATVRGIQIAMPHLEEVFQNRKSKSKMVRQLGLRFAWDYVLKKITVTDVERKIMELLGVRGAAVPSSPPELAFDIDYAEDFHYAVANVKSREAATS